MLLKGRRREDQPNIKGGGLPSNLKPGDYWKVKVQNDGRIESEWWIFAPIGGVARIPNHTVIENEDGTITVMPDQGRNGHMNSILIQKGPDLSWHGWIKNGVWGEDWEELERKVK